MAKARPAIPQHIADEVIHRHDRACCVCGDKLAGVLHHIDENPSNNDPMNLAYLCPQHHHEAHLSGGLARRLSASLIRKYRDAWLLTVQEYRDESKQISAERLSGHRPVSSADDDEWVKPTEEGYTAYVSALPGVLLAAIQAARPLWDSGGSLKMLEGTYLVIDVLKSAWLQLAKWYPPRHFGDVTTHQYLERYLADRYSWHRALGDPVGDPTASGSSAPLIAAGETLHDLEQMIEETVSAVAQVLSDFDMDAWRARWDEARSQ